MSDARVSAARVAIVLLVLLAVGGTVIFVSLELQAQADLAAVVEGCRKVKAEAEALLAEPAALQARHGVEWNTTSFDLGSPAWPTPDGVPRPAIGYLLLSRQDDGQYRGKVSANVLILRSGAECDLEQDWKIDAADGGTATLEPTGGHVEATAHTVLEGDLRHLPWLIPLGIWLLLAPARRVIARMRSGA